MKIGVDISDLATDRADGTTRYTFELARRLPELGREHQWVFFAPFGSARIRCVAAGKTNVRVRLSPWPKYWTQLRLPYELYRERLDVLFMPIQQLPCVRPGRMKTVAVVHDLAVHRFPEQFTRKDWLLLHIFSAQAARQADALICVSQATAADVAHYYGRTENVYVVHHGVDHGRFRPAAEARERALLATRYPALQHPYILFVGQMQPRKNLRRLVEAFEMLAVRDRDLVLVITGGHGWLQKPTLERIRTSPERARMYVLGRVPDELLPPLYRQAEVFVLPSLYEGFGMPVIEAFACGCPAVIANTSSLPEVAGRAAVLVDPLAAEDIARGVTAARARREELVALGQQRARGFTWEATARATLRVFQSLGARTLE